MPRADFVISPYGRGECPVCMGHFNLTKKGVLRHHRDIAERQFGYAAPVCKGVGLLPKDGA